MDTLRDALSQMDSGYDIALSAFSKEEIREAMAVAAASTSHTLRTRFMQIAKAAKLTPAQIVAVYAIANITNNRDRLLKAWDSFPGAIQSNQDWSRVRRFVSESMVTWPNEEKGKRFALIHLPATNPTIMAVTWRGITQKDDLTVDEFLKNRWAAQLWLDGDLRAVQKEHMRTFWNSMKTTSHETNRHEFERRKQEKTLFDEGIYATQEKDHYPLGEVNGSGAVMPVMYPGDNGLDVYGPFGKTELEAWIKVELAKRT